MEVLLLRDKGVYTFHTLCCEEASCANLNSNAVVIGTYNQNKNEKYIHVGHPINNYMEYIDNMARMKFNRLIIWNDHLPLNIEDVVKYAHEYEIDVILGFSWGWSRKCSDIDFENLDTLTNEIAEISGNNASVGLAGQLTGGIWFPPALIGQILWECDKPYDEIINKVLARRCIDMV